MAGHVYLIGTRKYGWYKIGKSSNATIRVTHLGILLPFRVEVIAIWKANNHHELEKLLHEKYDLHRINGEWFGFSEQQVNEMVESMKMAAVSILANFSNIEAYVEARDRKRTKKEKPFYTQEYRERRKQEDIARRAKRKSQTKLLDTKTSSV